MITPALNRLSGKTIATVILVTVAHIAWGAVRPPLREVEHPSTIVVDNVTYQLNDEDMTATARQVVAGARTAIIRPEITYEVNAGDAVYGWDFTVTQIATWFGRNNTSLRTISVPSTIEKIGGGFLSGCSALTLIRCESAQPVRLSVTSYNFSGVDTENCVLSVPEGSKDAYTDANSAAARYWRDFAHVVENHPMFVPGDVNDDGVVNGADVTALYEFILNGVETAGDCDVDNDGNVNGADVTALYNLLLDQ